MRNTISLLDDHDGIVLHGDCFDLFSEIPDQSIHAIITDPPYFLDGMGDTWDEKMTGRSTTKKQTVSSLRAGMKFDRKQSYDFQEFMSRVCQESFRVLKPGGWMLSMSAPRLYHRAAVAAEDTGFEIRDMWEWLYTQNQVKAMSVSRNILRDESLTPEQTQEMLSALETWKTPQVKSCFEPIVMAQKPREGTFYTNWKTHNVGLINIATSVRDEDGIPVSLIVTANVKTTEEMTDLLDKTFLVGKPSKDEKGNTSHLSVKPLALMRHLAEVVVPEGGIVVDPFSGSGSTGIGAIDIGRRYIGFENNTDYFDQSRSRFSSFWNTNDGDKLYTVDRRE